MDYKDLLDDLNKAMAALKEQRAPWEPLYRSISKYIVPSRGLFEGKREDPAVNVSGRYKTILRDIAGRSLDILAAGFQSGLTSPARPWFDLEFDDEKMLDLPGVRIWIEAVRQAIMRALFRSNFYASMHSIYAELGSFGIGAMLLEDDDEIGVRCHTFTSGEYYISADDKGTVDTFFRHVFMRAGDIVKVFGDRVPPMIRQAEKANRYGLHEIIHAIMPNKEYIADSLAPERKKYLSVYFLPGSLLPDNVLRVSGYDEFPVLVPRWEPVAPNAYSVSPGMKALGEVKMLMAQCKKYLIAVDKVIDPPIVAPTDVKLSGGDTLLPGGVTYLNFQRGVQDQLKPAYQIAPDLNAILNSMNISSEEIKAHFYVDVFLMLTESNRQITATEVIERHSEKLFVLGPVVERFMPAALSPTIERVYNNLARRFLLPEPPPSIEGKEFKIKYTSILAKAQEAAGLNSMVQTVNLIGQLSSLHPEASYLLDVDKTVRRYADWLSAPPDMLRSADRVAKAMKVANEQRELEEQRRNSERLAEGAARLASADTSGDNALTNLSAAINDKRRSLTKILR